MPFLPIVFTLLFFLRAPASSAATDTIFAGQALGVNDNLVSKNGRYALGFFNTSSSKPSQDTTNWYLGIWFNTVPKFTSAWVANRDTPIKNTTSLELTISHDGNLVILNRSTKSIIWSTQANITRNSTTAMLLSSGNFILVDSSNSSEVLWQSFDHPTNTLFPGAKLGWDKLTGLNRRLISWKNLNDPTTGVYCDGLDPSGLNQFLLTQLNFSIPYWSTGVWNGKYFASLPEMTASNPVFTATFVSNDQEKYSTVNVVDESMVTRNVIDVSGQRKAFIWLEGSQDWTMIYAQPKLQCDVYAICGPFTICNDNALPHCNCMEGFTITSPKDWELEDRTSGCLRNTPLDCISNKSTTHTTDKFYPVPCVQLPQKALKVEAVASASECGQVCLSNCSCTAYSFSDENCSMWRNELLNIRALQCSGTTNSTGETLYLRVSANDFHRLRNNRKGIVIGVATGTGVSVLCLFALILLVMILRNKSKRSSHILDDVQGCNRITAFRYTDLQRATTKFTDKLGAGSFGSVFKGVLTDSTAVAVKRLDGAYQGEKQFRAEVSSIGAVQHINLVKLVGFCCEGSKRLLVYEHMPNRSLDVHLFRNNSTTLNWFVRYHIALGVARGLAYLHESCRDCIIHCDIKPENILLDASFIPKVADFGMAKLLGRMFSRVLTTMRGTAGYLAPEWITGVAITPKVDVYSYGMVLLEIISGKRNSCAPCTSGGNLDVYFPVYAAHKLLEGEVGSLVDEMLHGDVNLDEAELACKVACWCIQDDEFDRPTMGEVVRILEGQIEIGMPPIPRLLQAMAGNSDIA
ncbi:G-type lectin S-receptor-like serine/threonine-protein kinase At2g19130 isoform X1 [Triticum urartu]|uniref:G-type lectin S-receptor-like serine/threonine-protein kinase At2g19130 isoform X1 n=1 Tax=Triticum urartu TaxID=4572 RepID=UPI000356CA0E|nr:G-type lectin S-receptor-like serine/threonine-protein kinase At2g19130 isoform X1 [Triticum urartu]